MNEDRRTLTPEQHDHLRSIEHRIDFKQQAAVGLLDDLIDNLAADRREFWCEVAKLFGYASIERVSAVGKILRTNWDTNEVVMLDRQGKS